MCIQSIPEVPREHFVRKFQRYFPTAVRNESLQEISNKF
jgi:hypothetical protein